MRRRKWRGPERLERPERAGKPPMRRDRHGKKVAGSGARVASSTPRHTPASNRGGAGRGSRRPVSAATQIDRSQLVYQSIAIELNGQNITRGEVIDALMGLVEERDVLTVTRLAHEWQVTFARKEPMEVIGDGSTITRGSATPGDDDGFVRVDKHGNQVGKGVNEATSGKGKEGKGGKVGDVGVKVCLFCLFVGLV